MGGRLGENWDCPRWEWSSIHYESPRLIFATELPDFRYLETNIVTKPSSPTSCVRKTSKGYFHHPTPTPSAPHFGGAWESLIKTAKDALLFILRTIHSQMVLTSAFVEVESIMNDRPIGRCSTDPNDPSILTPNHLLLSRGNPSLPVDVILYTTYTLAKPDISSKMVERSNNCWSFLATMDSWSSPISHQKENGMLIPATFK